MQGEKYKHICPLSNPPKIAIFVSFSGDGGVERMIVNLVEGLLEKGAMVDMIPIKKHSPHLKSLSPLANMIELGSSHTLTSLPGLIRYLKSKRPDALLAAKDRANKVAILAKMIARVPTRLVVRLGTTVSASLYGQNPLKQRIWYITMRMLYPFADRIVAVSDGVKKDLIEITGLTGNQVAVIPNPVISRRIFELSNTRVDHPWFNDDKIRVILGVGRLTRQKDFQTLIKAFARLRQRTEIPCKLIILGDGVLHRPLKSLAIELGLAEHIDLPGYVENPWAYMRRASLFVLSSTWEGSPNALTEALALGVPVIATDCPSGPREILKDGYYGTLVAVGNIGQMADAMRTTLENPPNPLRLKEAVSAYTVEASSQRYLETLLGLNV